MTAFLHAPMPAAAPQSSDAPRTVLASLLASRKTTGLLLGAGGLHVILLAAGLHGWPCPWLTTAGLPCPACGLGTASALLLRGDAMAALRLHAFAPLFLAAMAGLVFSMILKGPAHQRLLLAIENWERKIPFVPIVLAALFLYWAVRFRLDGARFLELGN